MQTEIRIRVYWDGRNKDSIIIEFNDNGAGFTDERFNKFSKLFDVEEATHRGLGRLSYLCYFGKIEIESVFDYKKKRVFIFDEDFNSQSNKIECDDTTTGSTIRMSNYQLDRIHKKDYLNAKYIKEIIYTEFLARLYSLKVNGKKVSVEIKSECGVKTHVEILNTDNLPHFEIRPIENKNFDLTSKFDLLYNVTKTEGLEKQITAIVIDNRCRNLDIISNDNAIHGYDITFLLTCSSFEGCIDASRLVDTFTKEQKEAIIRTFREGVNLVLSESIPNFREKKEKINTVLINRFPHLKGYFPEEEYGYVPEIEIIKKAQDRFLKDQREILNCPFYNEDLYEKSLNLASRTLTQYILFRQKVIDKLKRLNKDDLEKEFHNIIAPKNMIFNSNNRQLDIYSNNIWVLDERFMTYSTLLSDKQIKDIVDVITQGEEYDSDDDKPDIVIVFSDNPNNVKVDVVVIELKKKNLKLETNAVVETQLEKRVRALSKYYNNYIQRVWYYGIVEINDEYALHLLSNGWKQLYSTGRVFTKSQDVYVSFEPKEYVQSTIYIMDINGVIDDADIRNSTFINILKSKLQENS